MDISNGTRMNWFMEKTGCKKSRKTVPLIWTGVYIGRYRTTVLRSTLWINWSVDTRYETVIIMNHMIMVLHHVIMILRHMKMILSTWWRYWYMIPILQSVIRILQHVIFVFLSLDNDITMILEHMMLILENMVLILQHVP